MPHQFAQQPLLVVVQQRAVALARVRQVDAQVGVAQQHLRNVLAAVDVAVLPQPGQIGRLTYPRYGLEEGKAVLVRRVERNPATGDVVLTMWG